jgi:hypothetical protein
MNNRGRPLKNSAPIQSDLLEMLALWRQAADTPKGLIITSANPDRLSQRLYACRREVGGFKDLKVTKTKTEVWITPR